jgi:hypothetical protein
MFCLKEIRCELRDLPVLAVDVDHVIAVADPLQLMSAANMFGDVTGVPRIA